MSNSIIGGFFALERMASDNSSTTTEESVWSFWTGRSKSHYLFRNARSAISYILAQTSPARFWVPAYICSDLIECVEATSTELKYYPLDSSLNPVIEFFTSKLREGDTVLMVNYFGRPVSAQFRAFVDQRDSICWIEDCAQALDTGQKWFGDFQIFSPRKLFGVPDGGVLLDHSQSLAKPKLIDRESELFLAPSKMRANDVTGRNNEHWYRHYLEAENAMDVSMDAAYSGTAEILKHIDKKWISATRVENYSYLYERLKDYALYKEPLSGWVPLGFPIVVHEREYLRSYLLRHKVFPARHWAQLPSPEPEFNDEHELAKKILTLPCDQRYGQNEMKKMVDLISEALR